MNPGDVNDRQRVDEATAQLRALPGGEREALEAAFLEEVERRERARPEPGEDPMSMGAFLRAEAGRRDVPEAVAALAAVELEWDAWGGPWVDEVQDRRVTLMEAGRRFAARYGLEPHFWAMYAWAVLQDREA